MFAKHVAYNKLQIKRITYENSSLMSCLGAVYFITESFLKVILPYHNKNHFTGPQT